MALPDLCLISVVSVTAGSEEPDSEAAPGAPLAASGDLFVYEGPLAVTVRRLKVC